MDSLKVRQGATLNLTITNDETGADTATLTVSLNDVAVVAKTASFVAGEADLTLTSTDTMIDEETYDYMITVTYDDGTVEKYPDTDYCDECVLPTLTVCEANDVEVS